jgi:hypothetical protein
MAARERESVCRRSEIRKTKRVREEKFDIEEE